MKKEGIVSILCLNVISMTAVNVNDVLILLVVYKGTDKWTSEKNDLQYVVKIGGIVAVNDSFSGLLYWFRMFSCCI